MGVVKLADYRHNPVQHQEASSMGYVSIHRQFMDSRLYKDSQAVHLWLHLILNANHESTVVNTDIGPIPEHTPATRVGHLDDAYTSNGKPVGITIYQLPRSKYEELTNVNFPDCQ